MKKIHLIAAAAALLLSGGVFMKAYHTSDVLSSNIEALSISEGDLAIYLSMIQEMGSNNQFPKHAPSTPDCPMIVFDYYWLGICVSSTIVEENSREYNQIMQEGKYSKMRTKTEKKIECTSPGSGCTEYGCDSFLYWNN